MKARRGSLVRAFNEWFLISEEVNSLNELIKKNEEKQYVEVNDKTFLEPLVRVDRKGKLDAHSNKDYVYSIEVNGPSIDISKLSEKEKIEMAEEFFSKEDAEKIKDSNLKNVCIYAAIKRGYGIIAYNSDYVYANPSKIKSYKFIKHKDEYSTGQVDKIEKPVSEEAQKWLQKFMGEAGQTNPSKNVENELSQFKSNSSIKVYRGLGWHESESVMFVNFSSYPFEKGASVVNNYKRPSSWTANLLIAEAFAKGTGPYWVVLEATVSPKDILIDTRTLTNDILDKAYYYARQREVILKKGQIKAKIIKIGYKDNEDLDIGWESLNKDAWVLVEDAFKNLADKLNSKRMEWDSKKWFIGTPRQHYNGDLGISYGRTSFNEKDSVVVYLDVGKDDFKLNYTKWEKGSPKTKKTKNFKTLQEVHDFLTSSEGIEFTKYYGN